MNPLNDRPAASPAPDDSHWERHQRKCNICAHPDRDLIEQEFLNWRKPYFIAKSYGLEDHHSVYRHARAAGLYTQRYRYLRSSLSFLVEQASDTVATASSIVRAVQILARLDDNGRYIEPRRKIEHAHTVAYNNPPAHSRAPVAPVPSEVKMIPIDLPLDPLNETEAP
jgi:hypothetical protein